MKRLKILGVWSLILMTVAACANTSENNAPTLDLPQVVYVLADNPASFDPHQTTSPVVGVVLRQVYDTLLYRDPQTREFVSGLATDWSVSEDGLVYTFRLRDGVHFHDGTMLDASAIAANLNRIMRLDSHAASLLGPYRGYEIIDGRTISIRLSEPYSPLLDAVSQFYLGIASPLALAEYSTSRYQFYQVGTGPYRLTDFIPGQYAVLEKNEAYNWGPRFYNRDNTQGLQRIMYRFQSDTQARSAAIEAQEVAFAEHISSNAARVLAVDPSVQILPTSIPGQPLQLLINVDNFPTDNLLIRQALLYGTNRSEIVDKVFGGFVPQAWGPLGSSTLYYSREMTGLYDYDIAKALELLETAGFSDSDNDGYVDVDGVNLEVTVLVPPIEPYTEIMQLVRDQWRVIGVRLVLSFQPTQAALATAVDEGNYNMVAVQAAGLDPHFLTDYFATAGVFNWTGFSSEALDDVLQTGQRDSDPIVRAGAYVQAQRMIMNEVLVLPLCEVVRLNAVSTQFQAVQFDAYGWYPVLQNVQRIDG